MLQIKNISGGQIVCSLKSGNTLRIDNKETKTIKDNDVTNYIVNLISRGFLLKEDIEDFTETKTSVNKKKN